MAVHHTMTSLLIVTTTLVALLASIGCGDDSGMVDGSVISEDISGEPVAAGGRGAPCTESSQCDANFCAFGRCSEGEEGDGCFTDANCQTRRCETRVCVGSAVGEPCEREQDCSIRFCVDALCTDGQPGSPCAGPRDCVSNECDEVALVCR